MRKDKLHILFVSHEYFDDELPLAGGIGHFMYQLANELVKNGHDVTVMGFSSNSVHKIKGGVQLSFFKSTLSYVQLFYNWMERILHFLGLSSWLIPFMVIDRKRLAKKVEHFLREEQVDIVEVNDYVGDGAFLSIETPYIMRSHGSYTMLHKEAGFRRNDAFIYFEKLQSKKVKRGLGVSNFSSAMMKKYFQIKDIRTIYNGLDLSLYPYSKVKNTNRLLYFGTLSAAKGMDRLVQIFNGLIVVNPSLELIIAGKGKQYYKEKMYPGFSASAKRQVRFLGYIDKASLVKELDESSLVVFPSRIENFSLALLETMACARMAVCWDIAAFKEVIEDGQNGCIVQDVDQAIDKIPKLLADKVELQRVSDNARITIEDHFTWEKVGQENIDYYKSCIVQK